MLSDTKLKLIRILEILQLTDESNPLTAVQIGKKLKSYGIYAERKSICRDINTLIDANIDIERCTDNKLGYFMAKHMFEDWQLKILIDAVNSAKFLSESDKKDTIAKLISLSSAGGQKMLMQSNIIINRAGEKSTVKYCIDAVLTAIRQNRKIRFQYLFTDENMERHLRHDDLYYVINPYALAWQDEKYYLICNYDKYNDLSYYRLDRMLNLEILNDPVKDLQNLLGNNADLKIQEYFESTVYRYGGQKVHLRLFCKNGMQDEMIDRFGDSFAFEKANDGFFATVAVQDGDGLIYWLMQHGQNVKVLSPDHIKQKLIDSLRTSLSQYP